MKWFYGLKIKIKIFIPIFIISVLMVVTGGVAIDRFKMIDDKVSELRNVSLLSLSYLMEADVALHRALTEERSMLFLNVKKPDFAESFERHQTSVVTIQETMERFYQLQSDDQIRALYENYQIAYEKWELLTNRVAIERKSNTRAGRTTAIEISFRDGDAAFNEVRAVIAKLKLQIDIKAAALVGASHDVVLESRIVIISAIGIGLLVSILMLITVPRLVVDPIKKISRFMDSLAVGGGDLTHKFPVEYKDELGQMSESINTFIDSLRVLLVRVVSLGEKFNEQSNQLHELANINNDLAAKQSYEVSKTVESISELNHSVSEITTLSDTAAGKAKEAQGQSDQGKAVVGRTITAINKLSKEVQTSTDIILQLNENSNNIANVVSVINGIAEQTNLLALNAAIEAARAGEQGRGFAVVADSVRELASKTAESTQEIQVMISTLQQSTEQATHAMEQSKMTADESVAQADEAGKSLSNIDISIVEMSESNRQITQATHVQASASKQIDENTNHIANFATEGQDLAKKVESSAEELSKISDSLQAELAKFKL